jgi:hypothetical protein
LILPFARVWMKVKKKIIGELHERTEDLNLFSALLQYF